MMRLLFVALVWLAPAANASAANVLFIGNSFTFGATVPGLAEAGGVPKIVETIARAHGTDLHAESLTSPGRDWSWHLTQAATAAALSRTTWDWVVLQDYSTRPTRLGSVAGFLRDGLEFSRRIAVHSPHAGLILFETWSRPPGEFYHTRGGRRFSGPDDMMTDLHRSYLTLQRALLAADPSRPVRVAPVGTAFALSRARFPGVNLDARDQHHASAAGYYLAALVIDETIEDRGVRGAPASVLGGIVQLPGDEAAELQQIADEVGAGATHAAP